MKPTSRFQTRSRPGTVLAIRGTLDKREDNVRATAQKVEVLKSEATSHNATNGNHNGNGSSGREDGATVTLRFAPGAGAAELREVREILASSPGSQPVMLMMTSRDGETVRIAAGDTCRIELTPALEQRLAPWL